jgi:hypothetical protein
MFDLFLHPWFMIAGAALISAPIIIHLINRMRFRRVRWAAMEFLLKSQKRNRRRLIIEQLILLALRCALVALAGFLVARFIGGTSGLFDRQRDSMHLVVLDDTPSMNDRVKGEAKKKTFDTAKERVKQLAKDALLADSPQYLKLVRLSELDNVLFNDRLNEDSVAKLNQKLDEMDRPSQVHVKPVEAVRWARQQINAGDVKQPQRFFHLVSDLRDSDWSGSDADNTTRELDGLTEAGVRVLLLDVADPARAEGQPVVQNNDNLGISDLRPETRYAAKGMPVQFTLVARNYSAQMRKGVFLKVYVNGLERFEATQPIDLKPGESRHNFLLAFNEPGFNQITATLTGPDVEGTGIPDDDSRVAVIEVRDQLPVLMIDGSDATPTTPKDSYYLTTVFNVARGYQAVPKTAKDLEDLDLDQYPCVYLMNVAQLSDKAVKKLEDYVGRGGRIAFFVGDKVRPSFYNDVLYKNGKGLFPVPLGDRPTDKLEPDKKMERLFENQNQIFIRDKDHQVFQEVAQPQYLGIFKFLLIDQYWPTRPRFEWNIDPNRVKELVTLPNRNSMESYRGRAVTLIGQIPVDDEKYAKYKPALEEYRRRLRDAASGEVLFPLGSALEAMLNDRGDPANLQKRPDLTEFWNLPENQKLRNELNTLREAVQYGDPLVLSNRFGKGQTVVFLTTAGRAWNDWAGDCPASWTYVPIMLNLQKFLTGVGEEGNQMVGTPLEVQLDAGRYEAKARVFRQGGTKEVKDGSPAEGARPAARQDLGDVPGKVTGTQLALSFNGTREPGVYYLYLQPKPEPGAAKAPPPEERAYVFNVDTEAEGDLKRANQEALERGAAGAAPDRGKVSLVTPDMALREIVAPKRQDMSESPWLYLIILLVLVVEQALAVHLSFHLKGNELQLPGQARGLGMAVPAAEAAEVA